MPIGAIDLDPVWEFYQASLTCHEKMRGFLSRSSETKMFEQTVFYGKTPGEIDEMFSRFIEDLNDLVIVSLISVFEYILYEHPKSLLLDESSRHASANVRDAIARFEHLIHPHNEYNSVEMLCAYRDWVAHGKRWEKPAIADPFTAKKQLVKFLAQAGLDRQY